MRAPRIFLFFAVVCAVVSVTPLGDEWRFLVLLVPDWATVPNGYPFEAPHEQLVRWVVLAWHGLVTAGANTGWWSDAAAAAVIAEGFPLGGVLQLVAGFLFVLAALVWAMGAIRQTPTNHNVTSVSARSQDASVQSFAPNLPDDAVLASTAERTLPDTSTARTADRIAQLEIAVTNLLLKPDAQSVSEELADLSRQLRELSRQLDSQATPKN